MASFVAKMGYFVPEGKIKNLLRLIFFKFLFVTVGYKKVVIGTELDTVDAEIARLLFVKESTGEREIEGYLQRWSPYKGATVVNGGAYHGYFGIFLAKKVGPDGHIYCFEPEPNNLKLLIKNVKRNKINNITIINKGLWSSNAELPLISMGSGSKFNEDKTWQWQKIKVCRLDDELNRFRINKVDLITMDVEGAEIEALAGSIETLKNNKQVQVAIASYHLVNGEKTCSNIERQLRAIGMRADTAYPAHLTTYGCW